jgi:hypothetical protein
MQGVLEFPTRLHIAKKKSPFFATCTKQAFFTSSGCGPMLVTLSMEASSKNT